ncbi:hypothetical protein NA56DRAFT_698988 [Hyaloscypha hepaticicola]|uniref:Uncharacterized protein n=1 Tax=Hyaloscypha hepaticicola TaxID=2082293 RepID=A0A2J6QI29_9HELO|nr:hypothetical protein NA56DRAFT_698988 [Hyaloscypha hepaticicola]
MPNTSTESRRIAKTSEVAVLQTQGCRALKFVTESQLEPSTSHKNADDDLGHLRRSVAILRNLEECLTFYREALDGRMAEIRMAYENLSIPLLNTSNFVFQARHYLHMELSELEAPGRVLCSRCRELDVSNLWPVEAEIPHSGKPIISLGKRPHTVECDLCQFFIRQSPKYAGNYRLHVRFFRPFLSVLREDQSEKYEMYSIAAEVQSYAGYVLFSKFAEISPNLFFHT